MPIDEVRLEGRFHTFDADPQWLPEDRDIVAVWQEEQKARCVRCGTAPWEWEEDPLAWTVDHITCPGCQQIDGYQRELSNKPGNHDGARLGLFKGSRED